MKLSERINKVRVTAFAWGVEELPARLAKWEEQAIALEAENARLREALEQLRAWDMMNPPQPGSDFPYFRNLIDAAISPASPPAEPPVATPAEPPAEGERRFRKKPVEVEAVECSVAMRLGAENWRGLPQWLQDAYDRGDVLFLPHCIEIHTLEGWMRAEAADWIVRGIKNELYPVKPDIFAATYEPAAPPTPVEPAIKAARAALSVFETAYNEHRDINGPAIDCVYRLSDLVRLLPAPEPASKEEG